MRRIYEILNKEPITVEIDEQSRTFDLTIGTGFVGVGKSSVNIEIPGLTVEDLVAISIRILRIISYYHEEPKEVTAELFSTIPEYRL